MESRPDSPLNPQHSGQPTPDKTFVEGGEAAVTRSSLKTGARLDATSLKNVNPYTSVKPQTVTDMSQLPTGEERVPLGSGTVVGQLGTGGMARVYKIWNEKLEVFRAVKILLPTKQKDLTNRFETEAKITAKLHHQNIVEIYSVGEWNGLPFLEMEFIDGESLEMLISRVGRLPQAVCCSVAIFIARALVYAHGQEFLIYGKTYHGVIHRDLKPANIMISKTGDVRLMDFGIARPTEASLHTVEGNIVGTMQYLSPEQIDGVNIDSRTDIYSFGAILYEMLTGTRTFPQDTITNLMKKKIVNEYRKFSDFDFPIHPGLIKITQKCLQASQSDRFASAHELLEELEKALSSLTTEDPGRTLATFLTDPANFVEKPQKKSPLSALAAFTRRPWFMPAVAGTVVAGAAGVLVVTLFLRGGAPEKKQITSAVPATPPAAAAAPLQPSPPSLPPPEELKPLGPVTPNPQNGIQKSPPVSAVPPKPIAAARPPRTVDKVPTKTGREKPAVSSIQQLMEKYHSSDLLEVGRSALRSGAPGEAAVALENLSDNQVDPKIKALLLLEAYVDAGRTKDALFIVSSQNLQDAQFDFLCGKLYHGLNKDETAIEYLESSLTKPSVVRKRNDIRDDVLFFTAVVRSEQYRRNNSPDNRAQAVNAWNVVKRLYASTPDHSRARQAARELAAIQQ